MKLLLKFAFIILTAAGTLHAVEAYPGEITFTQKDGSSFVGNLKGDEYFHWIEDKSGHIIIYNKNDEAYEFAKIQETIDGMFELISSGIMVTENSAFSASLSEIEKIDKKLLRNIWKQKRKKAAKERRPMSELF